MTSLLRRNSRSKDWKYDPILANRSTSLSSISASKRSQSFRSTGGNSTDMSLAYSTDTEVRDMLEEFGSPKEVRVANDINSVASIGIVHPPCESHGLPRVPSKGKKMRQPPVVRIVNDNVPALLDMALTPACTFEDAEKKAREFETIVTARVDQALSPVDDKFEMILINVVNLGKVQAPEVESTPEPIRSMEIEKPTATSEKEAPLANNNPDTELFSGLLGSLFYDEPIPIIPATSSISEDGSSVATEDTSHSSQKNTEKPPNKFAIPTYSQFMEALLGDETMPNPLGPSIPSSIDIARIT